MELFLNHSTQQIDETDTQQAEIKKLLMSIRTTAMNMMAGREHCVTELRHKLSAKMHNKYNELSDDIELEQLIDNVIQQLLDDHLLDDRRYTESFINSRISKGSGPIKIRHELNDRGIASEVIDDFLDDSDEFWQEQLKKVRSKRFGQQLPTSYQEQSKQSRFLYQRGFGAELIKRCFKD